MERHGKEREGTREGKKTKENESERST